MAESKLSIQQKLHYVEKTLSGQNLTSQDKLKFQALEKELQTQLAGEENHDMMGLEIECKNPQKPVLECREVESPLPAIDEGKQLDDKATKQLFKGGEG